MRKDKSIKLKAAFLLTVFALNTVIAFACSMGLNLGYNKKHHHPEEKVGVSSHLHQSQKGIKHHHSDGYSAHKHDKSNPDKGDCCTKNAVKFQQVDKSHSHAAKIEINAPVILLALQSVYNLSLVSFLNLAHKHYRFIPPDHPPTPDIRVAIQSFQI